MEEIKRRVLELGEKKTFNLYLALTVAAALFALILPQISVSVGLHRSAGLNATEYNWLFIANKSFAGLLLLASLLLPAACAVVAMVKKKINVMLTYVSGAVVLLAGLVYLFSDRMTIGIGWLLSLLSIAGACLLVYWTVPVKNAD